MFLHRKKAMRMKRNAARMAVVAVAAAVAVFASQAPVLASTGTLVAKGSWDWGPCHVKLLASWDGHGNDYAAAYIADDGSWGYNNGCVGWLERSTDGGNTWSRVSGEHDLYGGESVTTYNYWDGAGYLARGAGYGGDLVMRYTASW
jgi:hypothetical protein